MSALGDFVFWTTGWGRLAGGVIGTHVIPALEAWKTKQALAKLVDGAMAELVFPYLEEPRVKSDVIFAWGEREVCGSIGRRLAQYLFLNPDMADAPIVCAGGMFPLTGWYQKLFIPRQTKAGIEPPTRDNVESNYTARTIRSEYQKLVLAAKTMGVPFVEKKLNILTAEDIGEIDRGQHITDNIQLAFRILKGKGIKNVESITQVCLPIPVARNGATIRYQMREMGLPAAAISSLCVMPDEAGVTWENYRKSSLINTLISLEHAKSKEGGLYEGRFFCREDMGLKAEQIESYLKEHPDRAITLKRPGDISRPPKM